MTTPITDDDAAPPVMLAEDEERDLIARTERAVAATYPRNGLGSTSAYKTATYVRNPANENRVLLDARQRPVTVDRILATKPFRQDLLTRPGPGGRRLTYISGEGISRSLNEIFGYEGWSLEIKSVTQTSKEQDKRNRWNVGYLAKVRLTLVQTGAYREDMGSGDSVDSSLQTAIGHAMKSSITDALKRAARHFGDKLGNSLYEKDFAVNKAPTNLFEALDEYERSARERVGVSNVPKCGENQQPPVPSNRTMASAKSVATKMPPPPVAAPVNHAPPQPPMITPNVSNKPVNTYQRNSLGAQLSTSTTSASSRSSLDASPLYSTPRNNNNNVPATTPLVADHRHTNTTLAAQQQQQQPSHMRSVLAENSAAVNPAPTNAATHVLMNRQHQYPQQQQVPLQRPPSSWGKRPANEAATTTTTEPPKQRPRHNPYA